MIVIDKFTDVNRLEVQVTGEKDGLSCCVYYFPCVMLVMLNKMSVGSVMHEVCPTKLRAVNQH